jgi:hypothetical protein
MKTRSLVLGSTLVLLLTLILWQSPAPADSQATATAQANPAALFAFRDSADTPPSNWSGPRFKLSHNYPKQRPRCEAPWLKRPVNFNNPNPKWEDWKDYVQDIINYVAEGQDPNLPDNVGWKTEVNGQTRWFHIPWMAYDPHGGREFVHGLTNELSTALSTFKNDPNSGRASGKQKLAGAVQAGVNPLFETWSVGMYNPCGAWSVGQVFPASGAPATYKDPKTGRLMVRGLPFPEGTVVMKVLNTTADADSVSYMKNSTNWQANGHKKLVPVPTKSSDYTTYDRAITTVHLVQVDLAVIDPRSPTRWVYSTLAYDGTLDPQRYPTVWSRLVPLGVQWGSDPESFPAVPQDQSKPLWQSVLAPVNLPEHYGCNKRLAGVVDNPSSSCVSCHMGAYAAAPGVIDEQGKNIPLIFVPISTCQTYSPASKSYFSNYKYPMPYPDSTGLIKAAIPLDSSLQLQVAFVEYAQFVNGLP